MGPVVPILRLAYLFLNIYDSYKVLKIPAPSARSGGQPSLRAMTQRKRDMKGVMTIWTVWVFLFSSYVLFSLTRPYRPRFPLWTVLHRDIREHGGPAHHIFPLLRRDQIHLPPLLYLHSGSCEYIHFSLVWVDRASRYASLSHRPKSCSTAERCILNTFLTDRVPNRSTFT